MTPRISINYSTKPSRLSACVVLHGAAIASDALAIIPHPTSHISSSSSSSYSHLPLSVVQTSFTDETAAQSLQDGPVDFSVTSRWTQSTGTAVKNDSSNTAEQKGLRMFHLVFYNHISDIRSLVYNARRRHQA